jgi:hypothetical protein
VSGTRRGPAFAALALLALLAAGSCGSEPPPSPELSVASRTANGITLAVRVTPEVAAGETAWADVVARAVAPVDYGGGIDSCDQDVWATVRRVSPEAPQPDPDDRIPVDPAVARAFDFLQPVAGEPAWRFRSQDERANQEAFDAKQPPFLGRDLYMGIGCGQPLVAKTLKPGEPVTDRMDWSTTQSGAPNLPGDYVATFGFALSLDRPGADPLVSVEVPIRVKDPGEPAPIARDTAARLILRDERVLAWHEDVPLARWNGSELVYANGAWVYLVRFDTSRLFVVEADGKTGVITAVRFEDHPELTR